MLRQKQLLYICIMLTALMIQAGISSANQSLKVHEAVSVKTGRGQNNIVNQFGGGIMDPFEGFAVDSKGTILIGDDGHYRVMRFSKEGVLQDSLTTSDKSRLIPFGICFDKDENIYVRNEGKDEIIVFSPTGKIMESYNPGSVVFKNKYKSVPIMDLSCDKATIRVAFGVRDTKRIRPIYEDEYDQRFNLIKRKIYDDGEGYYIAFKENNRKRGFDKLFEDSQGNSYGYPLVEDWYSKFLPLHKYSAKGKFLYKIDGPWLTKHTKYKVYEYFTMSRLGDDWRTAKGNNFMIVNWYVTPSGTIYVLLANRDYVKVLQIEEKD